MTMSSKYECHEMCISGHGRTFALMLARVEGKNGAPASFDCHDKNDIEEE